MEFSSLLGASRGTKAQFWFDESFYLLGFFVLPDQVDFDGKFFFMNWESEFLSGDTRNSIKV